MSTISTSTSADINVKYQRLAAEFVKIRNQLPVLKNAVIEKQSENEKLKEDVQSKETALRKLKSENESLVFRNDQLLKRVEALQETLDDTTAAFTSAKNKKKHKEANLRLFGETSRLQPSTSDMQTVFEQELERKLIENGTLHSKLFDIESRNEVVVAELTQRISALEKENADLKFCLVQSNTRGTISRNRHAQKSSDQQSDYYSDENTKELLDNQISEMPPIERITPHDEAKLYANGLLTSTKNVIDSFVNLFTFFEQRCTIYPCDTTLETLPASIIKFSKSLVGIVSQLKEINDDLHRVQMELQESNQLEELKPYARELQTRLSNVFNSSNDELLYALKQSLREECLVPWCNSHLEQLNNQWEQGLSECLKETASFLQMDITFGSEEKLSHLTEELDKLRCLFSDLKANFSKKIFVENHLPTASKRLKCVNECIEKSLHQLSTHFLRLYSMCSDYNAIDILAKMINGSLEIFEEKSIPAPQTISTDRENSFKQEISSNNDLIIHLKNVKMEEMSCELRTFQEENLTLKSQLEESKQRINLLENEKSLLETKLTTIQDQIEMFQNNHEISGDKVKFFSAWYNEKVEGLTVQLQTAKSQSEYYKQECESLLRQTIFTLDQNAELEKQILNGEDQNAQLNDDLETTRKNYEQQLRAMAEHLATLNAKIVEQSDQISNLKSPSAQSPVENGSLKQNLRKMVRKN